MEISVAYSKRVKKKKNKSFNLPRKSLLIFSNILFSFLIWNVLLFTHAKNNLLFVLTLQKNKIRGVYLFIYLFGWQVNCIAFTFRYLDAVRCFIFIFVFMVVSTTVTSEGIYLNFKHVFVLCNATWNVTIQTYIIENVSLPLKYLLTVCF